MRRRVLPRRTSAGTSRRTATLGALAAVLGLAAWLFAIPLTQTPDEPSHIWHAWGTVTGQTVPANELGDERSRTRIEIPQTLTRTPARACFDDETRPVPACPPLAADTDRPVEVFSYMTRYPPLYYALAGTSLETLVGVGAPGEVAILLTRVLSAALCAALLAWAALLLGRAYGALAALAVLLVGLTPTAFGLFVAVNPNGLEIAAAVLLAAAVLVVRRSPPGEVPLAALIALPVATTALAWSRPLAFVWAGALLALLLLPVGDGPLPVRRLPGVPLVATAVALAGSVAWFVWAAQARAEGGTEDGTVSDFVALTVPERLALVLLKFGELTEMAIGLFGWGDTPAPTLVVAAYVAVGGALVLLSLAAPGRDVPGWAPVALLAVGAGVAAAHTMITAFGWQGRYLLAFSSAAVILTTPALSAALASPAVARTVRQVLVVVVLPLHALMLAIVLWRFVYGQEKYVFRFPITALPVGEDRWEPLVTYPGVLALTVAALALSVTAVLLAPSVATEPVRSSADVPTRRGWSRGRGSAAARRRTVR